MTAKQDSQIVKTLARNIGFDQCGIARAEPIGRAEYLRDWLAKGWAGSMQYLHRNVDKRIDPRGLLEGAKSVIVVAVLYNQPAVSSNRSTSVIKEQADDLVAIDKSNADRPAGRVAMYAWGEDYHVVIKDKLFEFVKQLRTSISGDHRYKVCVDTVPLLEREMARAAGIGWIGKNTMVLNRRLGSFFFLGAVITTLELAADEPIEDHCGSCTACLDACPTDALPMPFQMNASRCISYLTIEHRSDIEADLAQKTGDWLFGCDICQVVCPFNREAPVTLEPRFASRIPGGQLSIDEVLSWTDDDVKLRLGDSAMNRAKPEMLARNAKIVQQNFLRGGS